MVSGYKKHSCRPMETWSSSSLFEPFKVFGIITCAGRAESSPSGFLDKGHKDSPIAIRFLVQIAVRQCLNRL